MHHLYFSQTGYETYFLIQEDFGSRQLSVFESGSDTFTSTYEKYIGSESYIARVKLIFESLHGFNFTPFNSTTCIFKKKNTLKPFYSIRLMHSACYFGSGSRTKSASSNQIYHVGSALDPDLIYNVGCVSRSTMVPPQI